MQALHTQSLDGIEPEIEPFSNFIIFVLILGKIISSELACWGHSVRATTRGRGI